MGSAAAEAEPTTHTDGDSSVATSPPAKATGCARPPSVSCPGGGTAAAATSASSTVDPSSLPTHELLCPPPPPSPATYVSNCPRGGVTTSSGTSPASSAIASLGSALCTRRTPSPSHDNHAAASA